MIFLTCIIIGVLVTASVYLMLGGELKEICMGVFLIGHAANLAIIAGGGSPVDKLPPILGGGLPTDRYVDPLPHALILTAIVIGFAVQAFLLTLLVVTWRKAESLDVDELGGEED